MADPDPTRFVEGAVDVFLRAYARAHPLGRASDAPKAGAETPALGNIEP